MTRRSRFRPTAATTAAFALMSVIGCVERTMTIRTEPDGATVVLNDEEVGTSPVTVPFTWYGTYDVICRKDGYATKREAVKFAAPWYQIPGVDVITECLVPVTFRDRRDWLIRLEPETLPTRAEVLSRAAELRDKSLYENE